MTGEEKYYRRAYNLLNELFEVYRDGFDVNKANHFWDNQQEIASWFKKTKHDQVNSLMLNIIIALLGINKESIEKANIVDTYNNGVIRDINNNIMSLSNRKAINYFKGLNTEANSFEEWLSIIKNSNNNKSQKATFKQVRNSLLHSNFVLDDKSIPSLPLTHLKTKAYYESVILNYNFFQFILAYFSNVPSVGIAEKTFLYMFEEKFHMNGIGDIKKFLKSLHILKIEFKQIKFNGENFLGNNLIDGFKENKKVSEYLIQKLLEATENDVDIQRMTELALTEYNIRFIVDGIEKNLGNKFFDISVEEQVVAIRYYLEFLFETKRLISSNLVRLFDLVFKLVDDEFEPSIEDFIFDKDYNFTMLPAIAILKAYLVIYRLQNSSFDEIDYKRVEFKNDDNYYISVFEDGKDISNLSLSESVCKNLSGGAVDLEVACKKITLEIFRNALAHGNIELSIVGSNGEFVISLSDVYKKRERRLDMTLDKFIKLVDSEAFLPKYCYTNEQDLSRSLKKEKP